MILQTSVLSIVLNFLWDLDIFKEFEGLRFKNGWVKNK